MLNLLNGTFAITYLLLAAVLWFAAMDSVKLRVSFDFRDRSGLYFRSLSAYDAFLPTVLSWIALLSNTVLDVPVVGSGLYIGLVLSIHHKRIFQLLYTSQACDHHIPTKTSWSAVSGPY